MRGGRLFEIEPKGLEGINQFYEQEVSPELKILAHRHKRALVKGYAPLVVSGALAASLLFYFLYSYPSQPSQYLVVVLLAATIVAFLSFTSLSQRLQPLHEIKKRNKALVAQKMSDFVGLNYTAEGHAELIDEHHKAGLLPAYKFAYSEDGFSGTVHGAQFTFVEALVVPPDEGTFASVDALFLGVLTKITLRKKISGKLLIMGKSGLPARKPSTEYQRVELEDVKFMEKFDVLGTDQLEARYILTPAVMGRLLDIQKLHWDFRASFQDGHMLTAFSQPDRFQVGSVHSAPDDPKHARDLVWDLLYVQKLSEALGEIATAKI